MERNLEKILGFNVDLFNFQEALKYITKKMDDGIGAQVVTINPEMIEFANKSPELAPILKNADLIIPDGIGIKIALKIKGIDQQQIPGIEFAKETIKICSEKNYPIALIGAKEEIITKAAENLKKDHANLNIGYIHNGFFDSEYEQIILEELQKVQPKLVLVALGSPKQELLITRLKPELPQTIFIGVGGSFDVWSGEVKRAPMIYRKLGCEWLYRTLKQPSRFKRIFPTLPLFLLKVLKEQALRR